MPSSTSHLEPPRTPRFFHLTRHAKKRMATRALRPEAVEAALLFGRVVSTRGAEIYALGRKEVAHYEREGIDLSAHEGVQVVVGLEGNVITVYRNHDFRGLRSRGSHARPLAA